MPRALDFPVFDADNHLYETTDAFTRYLPKSHAGLIKYVEVEGRTKIAVRNRNLPFAGYSAFTTLVNADGRPITDVVSSILAHGLATRFPKLRFLPVENGSAWVRPLVAKLEKVYDRSPDLFDEDPVEAFRRCIWVHPFHEEDTVGLARLIGVENVCFGSDYPHPEGMADPVSFVDELGALSRDDQARIMGGNLARILGLAGDGG
jgi:predicted TIM-barrel fold metal-dependent hydrolase